MVANCGVGNMILATQDQTPPSLLQDKGFYITFQIFNNIGKTNGKQS
jgi:hypothetical protein